MNFEPIDETTVRLIGRKKSTLQSTTRSDRCSSSRSTEPRIDISTIFPDSNWTLLSNFPVIRYSHRQRIFRISIAREIVLEQTFSISFAIIVERNEEKKEKKKEENYDNQFRSSRYFHRTIFNRRFSRSKSFFFMMAMIEQLSRYRKYVRDIRILLLFAGLWPIEKSKSLVYRGLPFFNAFVCFVMSCVVLNFCRDHLTNLDLLTRSIGIMGSYLSAVLKVTCFLVNRKELVELHLTLEKHFNEIQKCDEKLRSTIFDSLTIFVRPSFAITILVFIGTLVFFVTPLIVLFVQYSHDLRPLKYILPYPGRYPWSVEGGSSVYYVHYGWELLAGSYLFCVTCGVDSLFGYYVFQISAIFRMMSHRMRNLRPVDPGCGATIRDCVVKHRMLARCRDHLQTIYGPIVLWMFLTSAIIMCTLIFQASETPEMTVGYAILFTVYISMKLLQALMYAWYGGIVYTESELFREAVYSSGWPGSGDKSFMNNVLIIMNHKPLVLIACKFLIISTDMFATIVNATMSYFFLLQTLDEGN